MTDGSTTKKNTEYEAVVIRYIHETTLNVTNSFVGLCKVANGDAVGLADVITKCLDTAGIENWKEKLICLTVDGAAVNIGKHNGLVKLINSPIYIHCYNHILDLCLQESIKGNMAATRAIAFIKTLSSFYRTSPKLTRELFIAGEALNLKLLSFKPVCETRWADSLEAAGIAVIRNYAAVAQHLTDIISDHSSKTYSSSTKATAKGLLRDLITYEVIKFFYAFSDFMSTFARVSKYLETSDIDIIQSTESVKRLQMDLLDFGPHGELQCSTQKHLLTFLVGIDDTNISFQNVTLQKEKTKRNNKSENYFKDLCENASEIIRRRFSNTDTANSILIDTSKILNTVYFPQILPSDFGESQIAKFCAVFDISVDSTLAEWKEFREIMSSHFRPEINLRDLHVKLQTNCFKSMKSILHIVEIILTIPPSNAEVERIWSNVTHTLDDRSMSMGQETLQYRLQIKRSKTLLEEFDPTSAVNLWWSDTVRRRRPNFKD